VSAFSFFNTIPPNWLRVKGRRPRDLRTRDFPLETPGSNPETRGVRWKKVTLIGVGLLGGSLGLALRQRRLANEIVGFVRRATSIHECEAAGAVDRATVDLHEAVAGADLLVLCTPIAQMLPVTRQLEQWLRKGAIVTDVGSVKGSVVRELHRVVARAGGNFVGSHPMAGAEKTGVGAATADLFQNAVCVVTPTQNTDPVAVRKVERLWESVGGQVLRLSPQVHDDLVSRSSHLPHILAASLATLVLDPEWPREQAALCANGFRDATRIASGSPEMWRDIAAANRVSLGRALSRFIRDLERLHRLVVAGDAPALEQFLAQAKRRRDAWVRQAEYRASSPE
jgi:prephenate dehydrogenase